jgi:hypothetical protein
MRRSRGIGANETAVVEIEALLQHLLRKALQLLRKSGEISFGMTEVLEHFVFDCSGRLQGFHRWIST